jgi:hypothetical protein
MDAEFNITYDLFNGLLIALKIVVLFNIFYLGFRSHMTLQGKFTGLIWLFLYYLMVLIIFVVYEYAWGHIGLLFYVIMFA